MIRLSRLRPSSRLPDVDRLVDGGTPVASQANASPITVLFDPTPVQQACGVVATLSWQNWELHASLRALFATRLDEELYRIEVTADGLKAFFRPRPREVASA